MTTTVIAKGPESLGCEVRYVIWVPTSIYSEKKGSGTQQQRLGGESTGEKWPGEKQASRQAGRQAGGQANRQAGRQAEKQCEARKQESMQSRRLAVGQQLSR